MAGWCIGKDKGMTSSPSTPANLVDRLRSDHGRTEELLVELEADEPDADPEAAATLVRLLEAHLRASEQVLHPEIGERLHDDLTVQQGAEEHVTLREHLAVLQRVPPQTPEFAGAVAGLRLEFGQHARAEEDVAERLTGSAGAQQMDEVFAAYETARTSVLLGEPIVPLDDVSRPVVEGASPDATIA